MANTNTPGWFEQQAGSLGIDLGSNTDAPTTAPTMTPNPAAVQRDAPTSFFAGGPSTQQAGGFDADAFRNGWLASGGRTPQDLAAFVRNHPEFATGVTIGGSHGDHVTLPNGQVIDAVIGAGAGGQGAAWNAIDPNASGQSGQFGLNDPRLNVQQTPFVAPTYADAQQEPGYRFALDQGLDAVQNSAAAKGLLHSGNTLRGLNDYASSAAAGNYQNVFNRALAVNQNANGNAINFGNLGLGAGNLQLNTSNSLFNNGLNAWQANTNNYNTQVGQGLSLAQILLGAANNYGGNATDLTKDKGNADAAGQKGASDAINRTIGNIGNNALSSYYARLYGG